uniref:RING-CH-type domain-containing protein n=1 Tax=viral metagenome TaxID=1070528 RepID=A0A6C0AET7_9ZZZZ
MIDNVECRFCGDEVYKKNQNINFTKCGCTGTICDVHDTCLFNCLKHKYQNKFFSEIQSMYEKI